MMRRVKFKTLKKQDVLNLFIPAFFHVSEPIMERFLAWSVFGLSLEYPGGLWLVVLYYHITYIHNTFFHSIFIAHHIERFKI